MKWENKVETRESTTDAPLQIHEGLSELWREKKVNKSDFIPSQQWYFYSYNLKLEVYEYYKYK